MTEWFDTHCHLDDAEFDADRDGVYEAARAAGVAAIVIPAVEVDNFGRVRDCCERYPGCVPAFGIHPLYVSRARPADLATLRTWIAGGTACAIGEIGLDFHNGEIDAGRQEHLFAEQLRIARDFDLPVLLHTRRAVEATLKHLRRMKVCGGIAHAFSGSRQQADELMRLGFKLGFGGTLTFEGSRRIRELAKTLPLDAIVLETDAPDIPPAWLNRGRNSPAELPRIGAVLAELRGVAVDQVVTVCAAAARNALGLVARSEKPS